MLLLRHGFLRSLWLCCALTPLLAHSTSADSTVADSTPAHAAPADARNGEQAGRFFFDGSSYFSLGYSYAAEDFARKLGQASKGKGFHIVASGVRQAQGFSALLGKRVWKYIAVESQFEYVDGFRFREPDGDRFRLEVYTTTLNVKLFPLHDRLNDFNEGRLQPYLLTGIGLMVTKNLAIDTGASLAFRAGGGLDYFVDNRWALNFRSSYVAPAGPLRGLRFISTSIGFSYRLEP